MQYDTLQWSAKQKGGSGSAQRGMNRDLSPLPIKPNGKIASRRVRAESVSFRIDSRLRLILIEEAKKKSINLNNLVSQIFTEYVDWGRFAQELGILPFNKGIMKELFYALEKNSIIDIASRTGETIAREEVVFLFKHVNPETLLRYIERHFYHFPAYHHWYEDGRHNFTLQHDLGSNFSLFLKEYLISMFRTTVGKAIDFSDISPNAITFSIDA